MSVESDAREYGAAFLNVDASIRLYHRLEVDEPWDEWEYPRRIAVLDVMQTEPEQTRSPV